MVNVCQIVSDLLRTAFAYPLSENQFSLPCDLVVMYTHTKIGPIPPSRLGEIFWTNKQTDRQTERLGVKQ